MTNLSPRAYGVRVRLDILTKEYPPAIYGGAGVHVAELTRALRDRGDLDVRVRCFGQERDEEGTTGYPDLEALADANPALQTMGVDLTMAQDCAGADLVHSHTWYANHAGHLASLLHDVPHVISAHSLEPLRPWKAEQLGGGYALSSWVERTAYESAAAIIAVSHGMRADILRSYPQIDPDRVRVVHNGIDSELWSPQRDDAVLAQHGIDPDRPSVVFVGRITRQKGVAHLVAAAHRFDPDIQLVLCAGAPDTPEIGAEIESAVGELSASRPGVHWVREMLAIRANYPVFGLGDFVMREADNDSVLAFTRTIDPGDDEDDQIDVRTVLCLNNLSSSPQSVTVQLPPEFAGARLRDLFGGAHFPAVADDGSSSEGIRAPVRRM